MTKINTNIKAKLKSLAINVLKSCVRIYHKDYCKLHYHTICQLKCCNSSLKLLKQTWLSHLYVKYSLEQTSCIALSPEYAFYEAGCNPIWSVPTMYPDMGKMDHIASSFTSTQIFIKYLGRPVVNPYWVSASTPSRGPLVGPTELYNKQSKHIPICASVEAKILQPTTLVWPRFLTELCGLKHRAPFIKSWLLDFCYAVNRIQCLVYLL